MALAERVLELEREQTRVKEQLKSMSSDILKLQKTQTDDQKDTHELQLELAKGQGSLKTILVVGGAIFALLEFGFHIWEASRH